jgi:hypothetical protein
MTCQQVQTKLSLYLYGELEFAQEEELERHLESCSLCQLALAREKQWHTSVNSARMDVPLDLLSECRRELRRQVGSGQKDVPRLGHWWERLNFSFTAWSTRLAAASFLVFIGFTGGRWLDRTGAQTAAVAEMNLVNPATLRVRDIEPGENNRVRIIVDQVQQHEIEGAISDGDVRRLLLQATKDPTDPGIRVDSMDLLTHQSGNDVRDALLYSVEHDPNAAVRLKALQGLRRYTADPVTRETLAVVLEHDSNPNVRSEAIDVLVPANGQLDLSPTFAGMLESILRSERENEYVRLRCMQALQDMNGTGKVY